MTSRRTAERRAVAAEIRGALTARRPWIPCKYFYDDRGSRLFEEITTLPEYYQTRTEEAILDAAAGEIVARVRPSQLLELGSGAGRKVRVLLKGMARARLLRSCVLLDINELYLRESVRRLKADYPGTEVLGLVGDFLEDLPAFPRRGRRLAAFLGSTIGNLHPRDVPAFLGRLGRRLGPRDALLLGVDLVKDPARLEAAYNDSKGVTARFNLNILQALNDRLGADFDLEAFEHVAFYDRRRAWIEMRLRARRPSRARVPTAGLELRFAPGDEIRTEISCKYTRRSLQARLRSTGLVIARWFTDPERLFALALLEPKAASGRAAKGGKVGLNQSY